MIRERVGQSIFAVSNKLKRKINEKLQEFGVSGVQSRTLNYIYRHSLKKDVFQKDIELFLSIRSSSATELIRGLEELGFIIRKTIKSDKRKKKIELTAVGEKIAKESLIVLDEVENVFKEEIAKSEYNRFNEVLSIFENILDKEGKNNV